MKKIIHKNNIVKHHQWLILDRRHADIFVGEEKEKEILNLFKADSRRGFWVPDELIYGTYLYYLGLRHQIKIKCITYTDWTKNEKKVWEFNEISVNEIALARGEDCWFMRKLN